MTTEQLEHVVDKTGWPEGPWLTEPDRLQWKTAVGLPGLMVRHSRYGHWCGYAAVAPGHPLHGVNHGALPRLGLEVNYSDRCDGAICHVPEPGEPDDVWWFGFDCGHFGDFSPGAYARDLADGFPREILDRLREIQEYRDVAYLQACVEMLAAALVLES